MATYDLTAKSTTGVGANSIASAPSHQNTHMPQTSTNNPLYLIMGLCLLFVAFFIRRYNEKYI